jgi:hypothetical protein
MLGFPSRLLSGLVPFWEADPDDGHVIIAAAPLDEAEYQRWFAAVDFPPAARPKTRATEPRLPALIEKLRGFAVETATPIECMMFVSELKTSLRDGGIR